MAWRLESPREHNARDHNATGAGPARRCGVDRRPSRAGSGSAVQARLRLIPNLIDDNLSGLG